jgi:hypothetical protein
MKGKERQAKAWEGKGREGKGRKGKGREEKGREVKERDGKEREVKERERKQKSTTSDPMVCMFPPSTVQSVLLSMFFLHSSSPAVRCSPLHPRAAPTTRDRSIFFAMAASW